MEIEQLIGYVAYLLPAIVVGLVAYYFFKGHTANEEGRRRYLIQKEAQNKILPTRLQAYERLTLLLERIDPNTQQVYVSVECWNIIQAAKNATIHIIRQAAMHEKENTADTMREWILRHFMEEVTPSQKALTYIKKEVSELF